MVDEIYLAELAGFATGLSFSMGTICSGESDQAAIASSQYAAS